MRDDDARRVIVTELGANLLVEAGAGSGKTQMLAERMAAGVASGAYHIEHLAAVTFTRKAASELRGRFHLALEKRLADYRSAALQGCTAESRSAALQGCTTDADAIHRLERALGNLERFFAGTIHSFCARLLRERPVESGVSPGFSELDEVQDEELRNRAWRDFIANARAAGDADMLALLDAGVKPQDLDSAFAVICLNEDVTFPPGDGVCPDPQPAWAATQTFWKELQKHLPSEIDPDTTCRIQKAALDFQRKLRVATKRLDRAATIAELLEKWDCESSIIQKWWADSAAGKKRLKGLIEPLHAAFCADVVQPFLGQWRQYVYRLSVTLLEKARVFAARERHRRNLLNYGDLLNLAAKVLRDNAHVRRALQRKYRHLFVDEFQDTDPIQAEIVFLLAADDAAGPTGGRSVVAQAFRPAPGAAPDWRTVPVRPGALFVVGDPKQSIYRFRRADIEIYNTVRARFSDPSVGRVVSLTTNFRSVPALCEWANTVFDGPFPAEPTQHSPMFAPLEAHKSSGARRAARGASGLFTISHVCDDYREVPEQDAAAIARYIRGEVDAGRRRFSDFLVLTRKKRDRLAPYAAALEQLNVPIEVSGAGAFGESAEVKALTGLLRALADPQDALPLVAVLRGPLFGISDPELFAFKQAGGWWSIFFDGNGDGLRFGKDPAESVPDPPEGNGDWLRFREEPAESVPVPISGGAVVDALASLHRYYRWTRTIPAGAALDRILEHTGYLALAATTAGGVEAGDLLHAVDRVRQVFEDGGSLADAADALEADGEFTSEVESLPLEPGRTDVVRLMNLHKAKGLEANVVFLADPCGGVRPRVDVHIERQGSQALGWFKVEKKFENSYGAKLLGEHADWERHEQAELPFREHEETRLLYVAATRAREMLVVSRQTPAKGSAAWGVLNQSLSGAKELAVPAKVRVEEVKLASCSRRAQADATSARVAAHDAVNQASWSITSVTAEAKQIKRPRTAPEAAADDPTRVVAQESQSHRADAGLAWGTLIHGLLEHAMRHKAATRDDLRRLALWLTVEEPQLRKAIDLALDTVETASKNEFWPEARGHVHAVEVPFTSGYGVRLTNGVIDLLYEDDAGWQVVDYKTDVALSAGQYDAQLAAYREALQSLGCAVARATVVNVRSQLP